MPSSRNQRRRRAVLDLQACQTRYSRGRGIGRYTFHLTEALARTPGAFDYTLCVNGFFADSSAELEATFSPLLGSDRVVRYDATCSQEPWSAAAIDLQQLAGEWIAQHAWIAQKPDIVHVNSVFEGLSGEAVVPDVAGLPRGTVLSATAYDLIPLIFAETYLHDDTTRAWYRSRIDRLCRCDVLLAISDATRRDIIERLGYPADRVVSVQGATDERFSPAEVPHARARALLEAHHLAQPYVMYTGGIDHRKNVEGIIRAFAMLPQAQRDAHQLAIVCSVSDPERIRLEKLVRSSGLTPRSVVLTGFVSDADLVDLYRCCELFVFPSRYEGFGLPVLEAMACGAPTIAADTSSLPEIVGRQDALFSIDRDEHVAAAIAHALSDAGFRRSLREQGLARAKSFSWRRVADRAADAWDDAIARKQDRVAIAVTTLRPRLAVVTPLLPERSGIADFVNELLPHLAAHFRIELFVSAEADAERYRAAGFAVHPWQELPATWLDYDGGVVYQFGNSSFHAHMLPLLRMCPGTVFLHDAYLSGLMAHVESASSAGRGFFRDMLRYCHPGDAVDQYDGLGRDDAIERHPMSRWVADHATGVVVTSEHARQVMLTRGQLDGARCRVVAHQRSPRVVAAADRARVRDALGIADSELLVCSFGFAADRKLSNELIDAWCSARPKDPARLVLVGEAEGPYGDALRRRTRQPSDARNVEITGYVSDDVFHAYMQAADLVVQLRQRSRGEASGAALYAMAHGKPLVASRHGSLAEITPDACIHVGDPLDVDELARVLAELAGDADKRERIGARAQQWIRETCDPAAAARDAASAIACFNDPAIVRRRSDLAARVHAVASLPHPATQGDWAQDALARAARAEPARTRSAVAGSIARAIGTLVPLHSRHEARRGDESWTRGGTLTLLGSDSRLLTHCGVKNGHRITTAGRDGFLVYGPYIRVPSGKYRVRVYGARHAIGNGTAPILEAVCNGGRHPLAKCEMNDGSAIGDLLGRLDFAAEQAIGDLEIRIRVTNATDMAVDSIDLVALAS